MTITPADTDRIDADVRRFAELQAHRERIEHEQREIKARLRAALGHGRHDTASGTRVTLTPNRRFDPATAERVIPGELLPMVQSTIIDVKKARNVLSPGLFDQCRVEHGEPRVTIQ